MSGYDGRNEYPPRAVDSWYGPPAHGQEEYGYDYGPPPGNGFALTAMIVGIVGGVLGLIPVIGLILAVLALIFGILGLSDAKKRGGVGKGMAIAGIVLACVAFLEQILYWVLIATVFSAFLQDERMTTPRFAPPPYYWTDGDGVGDDIIRQQAYNSIKSIKVAIDVYIGENGIMPLDLEELAAEKFVFSVDVFDGTYYDDFSWEGAILDPATKRFVGTIIAHPVNDELPSAEIRYEADGSFKQGP